MDARDGIRWGMVSMTVAANVIQLFVFPVLLTDGLSLRLFASCMVPLVLGIVGLRRRLGRTDRTLAILGLLVGVFWLMCALGVWSEYGWTGS